MIYYKLIFVTLIVLLKNVVNAQSRNSTSLSLEAFLSSFKKQRLDSGGVVTFSFLICITAIRQLCIKLLPSLPPEPLVIMFGILLGVLDKLLILQLTILKNVNPIFLKSVILPLMLLHACMSCDPSASLNSWFIWFLIIMPLQILIAGLTGLTIRLIVNPSWNITMSLIVGFVFLPIFPSVNLVVLKNVGIKCKSVHSLLSAQMIFSIAVCANFVYICQNIEFLLFVSPLHVIVYVLRSFFGAIIVGFLVGTIQTFLLRKCTNDPVSMLLTVLSTSLCSAAMSNYFYFSGTVGLVVNAFLINKERIRISAECDLFLSIFWEILTFIINCFALLLFGIYIGLECVWIVEIRDAFHILGCYLIVLATKFFFYLILEPILRYTKQGYKISIRLAIVATWAGNFSCLNAILLLPCFFIKLYTNFTMVVLFYLMGVTFLLYVINVSTLSALLSCLGLTHVTATKEHNMTNCLKHILGIRDKTLKRLKMDKFMTDVNWPVVNVGTQISHPYKQILQKDIKLVDEDANLAMGYRTTTCENCFKEVNMPPSDKELEEMTREARKRILKARKVSFARQLESGMISQEAFRILTMNSDKSLEAPVISLKMDYILKYFHENPLVSRGKKLASMIQQLNNYPKVRPPNGYWRRKCYHIIHSLYFDVTILAIVFCNFLYTIFEYYLNKFFVRKFSTFVQMFFLTVYTMELIVKIVGLGRPKICCFGVINYFRSHWNKFDFSVYLLTFFSFVIHVENTLIFGRNIPKGFLVFQSVAECIRMLRILRLFLYCYPTIMKLAEIQISSQRTLAYEIGKSFLKSEEEALELLPQIIDITDVRNEIRLEMVEYISVATRELAIIQKENPHIAIEVKTRQAITIVLNFLFEGVAHLKTSGWLENNEKAELVEAVDTQVRIANALTNIPMNSVRCIFEQIPWMTKMTDQIDNLFSRTLKKYYAPGEFLCVKDEMPKGIFIIISGLFKITYKPQAGPIEDLHEYGVLPIVDHITSPYFEEPHIEYAASGHTVGELCFLTGRPYDSDVIAEVHSEVLLLPKESLMEAVSLDKDVVTGLEAQMWTFVSVRLVTAVLLETPAYSSTPADVVRFILERAVVPSFKKVKVFSRSDIIEDIVLIEGIALDFVTQDIYTAPTYIPRNVSKILLPQSSDVLSKTTNTKLLIIPLKDTSIDLLREKILKQCEMVDKNKSSDSEKENVMRKFTIQRGSKSSPHSMTQSIQSDDFKFRDLSSSSSDSGGYDHKKCTSKTKVHAKSSNEPMQKESHDKHVKPEEFVERKRAKSLMPPPLTEEAKQSKFAGMIGKSTRRETVASVELGVVDFEALKAIDPIETNPLDTDTENFAIESELVKKESNTKKPSSDPPEK